MRYQSHSAVIFFLILNSAMFAGTGMKGNIGSSLRKPTALYEQRLSTMSNHEFYVTNYGVLGQNIATSGAGWFWPRQSYRTYIYGQSIWFGVRKLVNGDTAKLVSVGYNPNSGVSWFGPGSIDDGLDVLLEGDPISAKYYMYIATDFSAEGKHLKNPSLPDWPIRWVNLSKTPGKNGYYGDYVSNPLLRSNYKPVFITQEDMFCIYKDSDTKRNPEFKVGSGYPIGVDVLQSTYSWNFGPFKDIVYFSYTVINKSKDTLRDCYLAPASDPDIGNAVNDHVAYYSKDQSLNLGFQFTETEPSYSGVLGMDFLESPRVKTAQDSVNVFRATGIKRKIGEQIGLTTFRNWTIDVDPANGPARYDFMASGARDGDNVPGDKRFLMGTGPFRMLPGDTARVILCIMIAPGIGAWNASPDVMNSGYLDSLVSLDKFAQNVFETEQLGNFPLAFVESKPSATNATLNISVDGSRVKATAMTAKLALNDGTPLNDVVLFDDGAHGDGAPNDKVFGNSTVVVAQKQSIIMNLSVTDDVSKVTLWSRAAANITTTALHPTAPTIFSDNLNNDGKVNVGENVRYGITVANSYAFGFSGLTLTATPDDGNKAILLGSVAAVSQISLAYNPADPNSYFSFTVPSNQIADYKVAMVMSDDVGNIWRDTLSFPVFPFQKKDAVMQHVTGSAEGNFEIVITDQASVKNHMYVIRGIDSVDVVRTVGFSMKDSSDGRILFQNKPLPDLLGHSITPTDGFKLFRGTVDDRLKGKSWSSSLAIENSWFIGAAGGIGELALGGAYLGPTFKDVGGGSTIYRADFHSVKVQFGAIQGFTDLNANGIYDVGEPYKIDTNNTQRSQKAYFYGRRPLQVQYVGYRWVPFTVFDLESNPPRQLTAIVLDNDQNNQWDIESLGNSTKLNYVWILSDSYDPQGIKYDSTKGGSDLSNIIKAKGNLPSFWVLWLGHSGFISPYSANVDLVLNPTHPISSRDAFIFNPTVIMDVSRNTQPSSFSLDQNYPNPFNPSTRIRYALERTTHVKLRVYDILGQLVKTAVDEVQNSGTHEVVWDGKNGDGVQRASGVYFFRIEAGSFIQTKKMVLLK